MFKKNFNDPPKKKEAKIKSKKSDHMTIVAVSLG